MAVDASRPAGKETLSAKFTEFFALKLAKRCFVQLLSSSVAFAPAGNRHNEY